MGAKTQDIESVAALVVPPTCPKCGSSEFHVIATTVKRQISGMISGFKYEFVKWRRCRCLGCKQIVIVRTYEGADIDI